MQDNTVIINSYEYTKEISEETQRAWWKKQFKAVRIAMLVIIGIDILQCIYGMISDKMTNTILGAALVLAGVFILWLLESRMKKAVRMEAERFDKLYGTNPVNMKVEISDAFCFTVNENQRTISKEKLSGYLETDQLFIFMFNGTMTLPLKKDSFSKGDVETCRKLCGK